MQMLMSENGPLNPQESVVSALHAINVQYGLICLDDKNEVCEFPANWKSQPDGSYTFRYKNEAKKTVVKFKMTLEEEYVVVMFAEEGSKESYRVTIDSKEEMNNIIKQFSFTLKQYIGKGNSKPIPVSTNPAPSSTMPSSI